MFLILFFRTNVVYNVKFFFGFYVKQFLIIFINLSKVQNIGDPQEFSNYKLNTHDIEREVLAFFAELLNAGNDFKGYVTSGGTEGNFFGLHIANQLYPDAIYYYSERTHYSIPKILKIIKGESRQISALENGEINYQELKNELRRNKHLPAVFNANIGTTMTGAIDDIEKIQEIVHEIGIKHHYIHCDAALSGLILPFVDQPQPFRFDEGANSIAISGHKLMGSPMPCGITLTQKKNIVNASPKISYVRITDSTITSSRNGITPLFLWYAIHRSGKEGLREIVQKCLENTQFAVNEFKQNGIDAWSNPNSLTIVLPRPSEKIIEKWQLAAYENIAHIIVMPQTSREFLLALMDDILNDNLVDG
ncbi:histidine decarboxylase [Candidiatus Paracoxiella cheracis]|uniref:histidine decarboxylase n=1 Tax=Candidiatus Paracoxiella cheracis TaxID=3405120 RepID=UPI003BF4EDA3